MARIKSTIVIGSKAIALVLTIGLTAGPDALRARLDDGLSAVWNSVGDRLATRELDASERHLERERRDADAIARERDTVVTRLLSLEARRERAARPNAHYDADSPRALSRLDASITILDAAVARADRALDTAVERLHEHEVELMALRAAADVRRMERAIAEVAGGPARWDSQVAHASEYLRADTTAGDRRDVPGGRARPR